MIKPKQLNKGDKIAIVSLSSGILGEFNVRHQLELGIKRLEELGLEPVFMPNSLKGLDFVKNNPSKRADDLRLAFENPTIKGIICAIGGDDTYKTIPYLMNEEFEIKSSPKWYLNRTNYGVDQLFVPLNELDENKGHEFLNGSGVIEGVFWGGCLENIYDFYTSEWYQDQRNIYVQYGLIPNKDFLLTKSYS
jgi:muramoyltetrapeptide carboxypeptidase LdcA involved in peptidoglycan recycling